MTVKYLGPYRNFRSHFSNEKTITFSMHFFKIWVFDAFCRRKSKYLDALAVLDAKIVWFQLASYLWWSWEWRKEIGSGLVRRFWGYWKLLFVKAGFRKNWRLSKMQFCEGRLEGKWNTNGIAVFERLINKNKIKKINPNLTLKANLK